MTGRKNSGMALPFGPAALAAFAVLQQIISGG
jgi:hypothetical protein